LTNRAHDCFDFGIDSFSKLPSHYSNASLCTVEETTGKLQQNTKADHDM